MVGFNKTNFDYRLNINSKTSINQFVPISLQSLIPVKKITFRNKNLKTSYLIDLVHNLIWKYYCKKENQFNLSSVILKEKYGSYYNYYVEYLIQESVIRLHKNYRKGYNARIYEINSNILKSTILRFENSDRVILKKWKKNFLQNISSDKNSIKSNVKNKLISDLNSVTIDYDASIEYLTKTITNNDVLHRNLYSIQSICSGDLFYHFDSFGRFHTNFTILKSHLRKNFLKIDGESTCEIDIKNSQPLFLSKLIYQEDSKLMLDDDIKKYMKICYGGDLYSYINDRIEIGDKSDIKKMLYKVFFGKNYSNKQEKLFQSIFPKILNYIKNYKKSQKDYRALSWKLQQLESEFVFNLVISKITEHCPNIKVITCHDSIIVKKSDYEIVYSIFKEMFESEFDFIHNLEMEYI